MVCIHKCMAWNSKHLKFVKSVFFFFCLDSAYMDYILQCSLPQFMFSVKVYIL